MHCTFHGSDNCPCAQAAQNNPTDHPWVIGDPAKKLAPASVATYCVVTRWIDREGNTFDRTHRYEADTATEARKLEAAHNKGSELRMSEDGFRWAIVSVKRD